MTECNVVTGISAADFGISRPLARLGSGPCNTNITYEYDSEREKRPLSNASQYEALKILGKEPLTPDSTTQLKGKLVG